MGECKYCGTVHYTASDIFSDRCTWCDGSFPADMPLLTPDTPSLDAAEGRAVGVPDDASDYAAARKYAAYLAQALREQHYPSNTTWQPMPDLLGLLTQIDNMVAGALHPASPLGAVAMKAAAAERVRKMIIYPPTTLVRQKINETLPLIVAEINALPTTFTDAELLAAAAELPEVKALVEFVGHVADGDSADYTDNWKSALAALAPFARKGGQ